MQQTWTNKDAGEQARHEFAPVKTTRERNDARICFEAESFGYRDCVQNRKKEINNEIDAIQQSFIKAGRPTKEASQAKTQISQEQFDLVEAIKQRTIDAVVGKTVGFAQTAGKQLGLQEPTIADNTKQFLAALKKDNVALDESSLSKVQAGLVGGAAFNGKIYINKEVAAKTKQINVGAHEVLHPIINARIQNQPEFVEQFKQTLTKRQLNTMEDLLTRRQYTGEQRAREYFSS